MKELIYYILVGYGLTQILVYGRLFDKIRPKNNFFNCPMCIGFWVGLFLGIVGSLFGIFGWNFGFLESIALGFLNSGTAYILCTTFDD